MAMKKRHYQREKYKQKKTGRLVIYDLEGNRLDRRKNIAADTLFGGLPVSSNTQIAQPKDPVKVDESLQIEFDF